MQQKMKRALRLFILYAYIPLSVVYMEILLRLLGGYPFRPGLTFALFASLCAGVVINLISLAFAGRVASRAIAGVLLGVCCFVYALEYFMYSTYKVYMSVETIILSAGNVIGDFTGLFFSTILAGIPLIIAFFLPFIVFLPLTGKRLAPYAAAGKKERLRRVFLLAYILGLVIIGQAINLNKNAGDKAAFSAEYNFDSTSHRLGMLTGLSLDLRNTIFGTSYAETVFQPVETLWEPPAAVRPQQAPIVTPGITPSAKPGGELQADETAPPEVSEPPAPIEYGWNMMDIDFDALIAGESDSRIRALHEYAASLAPSRQNEYTGLFKGKNLILITAEAFSKEVVDPVMTPTLYRLVHNGFYFSDYYQPSWGGSTSSGEFAFISGLAPALGAVSVQRTIGDNLSYMIGNKLMRLGYFSAAYHNGNTTYYNRDKTHTGFGYSTFTAIGNGMESRVNIVWPASDLEMMEYSIPQYIDEQPFSVYYMTVSGHATYSKSFNAMSAKNWDAFPEQYEGLSNKIRGYFACNLELEYALQYLVSSLEAAGIADDTVIALSADHYPYGLEKSESWGNDRDYLHELFGFNVRTDADRDHSALIIWSGCLENEYKDLAVEISSPVFSLDALPTLCNLFGVEFDSRLLAGRDVFSDTEPLVFWLDRSWKTDLGYFDVYGEGFIPIAGIDVPDEYISRIRAIVNNKIAYSDSAINNNYFDYIFTRDGALLFHVH